MMDMNQNNKIKVGINGFGRIGRLAFRASLIKKDAGGVFMMKSNFLSL